MPITIITSNQNKIIIIGCLVLLTLAVYWDVQCFGFINYDDHIYVTKNFQIQAGITFDGIIEIFSDISTSNWHPLTMLSHMLDWELFGENAGGHHWTNLIFHICNTILLFLLLNRMTGAIWRSGFVAALFAIHPINVESVAWVAERKNVLSTFFWFLTMLFYVWYAKQPHWKRYLPVFICFALGLMSKSMLVTLPFVLLLMDYWPLNRTAIDTQSKTEEPLPLQSAKARISFLILEKIPLFVLTFIFSSLAFYTQHKAQSITTLDALPLFTRLQNAVVAYALYCKKMFWPLDLSVFYPYKELELGLFVVALCFLLLISALAIKYYKKRSYLLFSWLWYLGTLIPVIGLVQIGKQSMADRYAYVPMIGLFIILAWWTESIAKNKKSVKYLVVSLSILFILSLSVVCWQRCQLWGNSLALWNDVLKNHQVAFAYNLRGLQYAQNKQYGLALADYNLALQIEKNYAKARHNRAIAYSVLKQNQAALDDYQYVLKLAPEFADAYYNRGLLYLSINQLDAAISDFTKAIDIDPNNADYFNNRGVALRLKNKHKSAFTDFTRALKINENLAAAYYNRGMLHSLHNQHTLAVREYNEALQRKPSYINAYFGRGTSYLFLENYNDAARDFLLVLKANPHHIPALNNLGLILQELGKHGEAAEQYRKILKINPYDDNARKQLREIANLEKNNHVPRNNQRDHEAFSGRD